MEWEFNNDAPIYQQIVDQMKREIAVGNLEAGEKLPSVRDLALAAAVNPNTMQKALAELEREGLVYSKRTAGRFVAEESGVVTKLQEELVMEYIKNFMENMERLGYTLDETIAMIQKYSKEEGK